jgi:midasin
MKKDLLRWAERKAISKEKLAEEGYMLLCERLRNEDEKDIVWSIIQEKIIGKEDMNRLELEENIYFGSKSRARERLKEIVTTSDGARTAGLSLSSIAPTQSLLRLLTLVERCVEQKEPILLVGGTHDLLSYLLWFRFLFTSTSSF